MEPLRILIAEDESLTRAILRTRLEKLGHQIVAEAENGLQALEAARATKPDAILMDIRMPVMDGIEAARQIIAEHPCALLFLTAYNDEDLVQQASETGALAYLMKPFRKEELAPALEIAMRRFRQLQDQNQRIACLKEALETRKIIERAKGILMDQHGMTEQDAFRYIHFKARSQNKKMREIAEGILAEPDKV